MLAARALVEKGDVERATLLIEETLRSAPPNDDPRVITDALDFVLALQSDGQDDRAGRALEALRAHLGTHGLTLDVASPRVATAFGIATELATTKGFPPQLRRAFAQGALVGSFDSVVAALTVATPRRGRWALPGWRRRSAKRRRPSRPS